MAELSNWEFWQHVMGDSDDDGSVFEGFQVTKIRKQEIQNEDSDFDPEIVTQERGSSSDEDDESGDDVILPQAPKFRHDINFVKIEIF